jgi:hypothetical protein
MVSVCDREASIVRRPWPHWGGCCEENSANKNLATCESLMLNSTDLRYSEIVLNWSPNTASYLCIRSGCDKYYWGNYIVVNLISGGCSTHGRIFFFFVCRMWEDETTCELQVTWVVIKYTTSVRACSELNWLWGCFEAWGSIKEVIYGSSDQLLFSEEWLFSMQLDNRQLMYKERRKCIYFRTL